MGTANTGAGRVAGTGEGLAVRQIPGPRIQRNVKGVGGEENRGEGRSGMGSGDRKGKWRKGRGDGNRNARAASELDMLPRPLRERACQSSGLPTTQICIWTFLKAPADAIVTLVTLGGGKGCQPRKGRPS